MSLLSRLWDDASFGGLTSVVSCCGGRQRKDEGIDRAEKSMTVLHRQPRLVPDPVAESQWDHTKKRLVSSHRNNQKPWSKPRRPLISAPMEFVHIQQIAPRRGFRPLELSIYMPENRLSPILPHLAIDEPTVPSLIHTRSDSALSAFTIRRKPLSSQSIATLEGSTSDQTQPLRARPRTSAIDLQKPLPVRMRADTAPAFQIERVVSALQEKDELDRKLRDIDIVIEGRQSVYNMSRPGSQIGDTSPTSIYQSDEPLPAMPPRLRPQTAPSRPIVNIPIRAKSFDEAAGPFRCQTMAPPLPLVLAPPENQLRKKSFSRVSNWLFPEQQGNQALESITNTPKPVTSREGFYQCIQAAGKVRRDSTDTVTTWNTEVDHTSPPTSFTEESSPQSLRRTKTFGEGGESELSMTSWHSNSMTVNAGLQVDDVRISRVGMAY